MLARMCGTGNSPGVERHNEHLAHGHLATHKTTTISRYLPPLLGTVGKSGLPTICRDAFPSPQGHELVQHPFHLFTIINLHRSRGTEQQALTRLQFDDVLEQGTMDGLPAGVCSTSCSFGTTEVHSYNMLLEGLKPSRAATAMYHRYAAEVK